MMMRFAALAALASLANCDDDADAAQPLSNRMGKAAFEALKHDVVGRSFAEAKELFAEAGFPVGTHSAQHAAFPQDKIEHMVVLFVENRASDHIWGCMLGDRPGFDGIPSDSAAAKDNITGCGTATLVCKGKKTPLLSHFCTKKDYFTKTGSGQT
jgi:phospholipase C